VGYSVFLASLYHPKLFDPPESEDHVYNSFSCSFLRILLGSNVAEVDSQGRVRGLAFIGRFKAGSSLKGRNRRKEAR